MSQRREGVGLALSGGGYRASLFHLGAACRLHELGLLKRVTHISSVSGGSILSGHLANAMMLAGNGKNLEFKNWEEDIARPFREFVSKDIRTKLVLKYFGWGQLNPNLRTIGLRDAFFHRLTKLKLEELQKADTKFTFLATDLEYGTAWQFTPSKMFTWRSKDTGPHSVEGVSVATAIAASASFPPVFGPMKLELKPGVFAYLSDGGVYDNSGVEPLWMKCETVMVSDAGKPFKYNVPKGYFGKLIRYSSIAMEQVRAQRHRYLVGMLNAARKNDEPPFGTLWRLNSKKQNYQKGANQEFTKFLRQRNRVWYGYTDTNGVTNKIHNIRTDLDGFTQAESKILINHGYFYADIAIARHMNEEAFNRIPFSPPHKNFLDDAKVWDALEHSHSIWRFWRK